MFLAAFEVYLIYKELRILNVYKLMSLDISM